MSARLAFWTWTVMTMAWLVVTIDVTAWAVVPFLASETMSMWYLSRWEDR